METRSWSGLVRQSGEEQGRWGFWREADSLELLPYSLIRKGLCLWGRYMRSVVELMNRRSWCDGSSGRLSQIT